MRRLARLGIGLPVRNGGRFLREAAGSLLSQTFGDFELLISDNASTDDTPEICEELARRDPRVRFVRQPENIGAARNFNFVFRRSRGEYFKWAAHDDVCDPAFLERCVERLDLDRRAVLCHARSRWIGPDGADAGPLPCSAGLQSPRPSDRFIAALERGYPAIIWGVMRRTAVQGTGLIGGFVNADRYFLAGLLLRGPAEIVPRTLFSVRRHGGSFTEAFHRLAYRERLAWFNPRASLRGLVPMAAAVGRLARLLATESMPWRERTACAAYVGQRAAGFVGRRTAELLLGPQGSTAQPITGPAGGRERGGQEPDPEVQFGAGSLASALDPARRGFAKNQGETGAIAAAGVEGRANGAWEDH